MHAKKQKITPLFFATYLALIKNSVGIKTFRNFYVQKGAQRTDITKNGNLSCAFFVSSILVLCKFIKSVHVTVDSTVRDLKKSGWKLAKKPKPGDVLVWESFDFGSGHFHKHIGFYIGKDKAISNNFKKGYPMEHHWKFKGKRNIELILTNKKLA